ncbi:hypothetical protein CSUI_010623, partial [Cystoisospora suis]
MRSPLFYYETSSFDACLRCLYLAMSRNPHVFNAEELFQSFADSKSLVADTLSSSSSSSPSSGVKGGGKRQESLSSSSLLSVEMTLGNSMSLPLFLGIVSCLAECRGVIAIAAGRQEEHVLSHCMQSQVEILERQLAKLHRATEEGEGGMASHDTYDTSHKGKEEYSSVDLTSIQLALLTI